MANENNDVQSGQFYTDNNQDHGLDAEVSLETGDTAGRLTAIQNSCIDDAMHQSALIEESGTVERRRGVVNDLVADVCKGHGVGGGNGDYTNVRATTRAVDLGMDVVSSEFPTTGAISTLSNSNAPLHPPQNSSFSFKHFLNSSSNSATVLSTTASTSSAASNSASSLLFAAGSNVGQQTSTGARPKVPQSSSVTTTSISSLMVGCSGVGLSDCFAATKMKRSPRFSSFDSQASLAEYASGSDASSVSQCNDGNVSLGAGSSSTGFQSYSDSRGDKNSDMSNDRQSGTFIGGYVPRSYSNYDMPQPPGSPRRRFNNALSKDVRSSRLSLNTSSAAKLKLDLPIDSNGSGATSNHSSHCFPAPSNVFPATTAAAASTLPDFVQDHWLDSFHTQEMHLREAFVNTDNNGAAASCGGPPMRGRNGGCSVSSGSEAIASSDSIPTVAGSSKMLPDFLSDGLIIHSSQRLADVAAGLPANVRSSPEETSTLSQFTRLRFDNEHLLRELSETRSALNDQTRRVHNLERQLQELTVAGEEKEKRLHTTAAAMAQSNISKLTQQVSQLTAEVEMLRYENNSLREDGAVGGCGSAATERGTPAGVSVTGTNSRSSQGRSSRTELISRNLLRAASNAENNLRQLLTGVDNLRQMAADIENADRRQQEGYDVSPDLFSDFVDDCDDFQDYSSGPTL